MTLTVKTFTTGRLILLGANILAWGCLIWSGWDGMRYVEAQHVRGYPNDGQFEYYVLIPVAMMAAVTPAIFLWRTRLARLGTGLAAFTLVALLPYLFFYTGGM